MKNSLEKLWLKQKIYNEHIRGSDEKIDPEDWTEKYLLGMVSEIGSVLDEINWKRNRKHIKKICKDHLGYELADLTKYLMSLWDLWGFTPEDMLQYVYEKTAVLEQQYVQEFAQFPHSSRVAIVDLDGTISDWRRSFGAWIGSDKLKNVPDDPAHSIAYDVDNGISYPEYYAMKDKFEEEGGYRNIYAYPDGVAVIRHMLDTGIYVIIYTARPVHRWHRIWLDTWVWLENHNILPESLYFGSEPRILLAKDLMAKNNDVLLFEDDPELIRRALSSGIRVIARRHHYNKSINHPMLLHIDEFYAEIIDGLWIPTKSIS